MVTPQDESRQHLLRANRLLAGGDYEAATQENVRALEVSAGKAPGDEALYSMGFTAAHPGNPKRDLGKSIALLKRLMAEYPQSPLTEQARVWAEVMQESEKSKRAWAEAAQESEKSKRALAEAAQENAKLKQVIEQSKKVDVEIEEKKREKAR